MRAGRETADAVRPLPFVNAAAREVVHAQTMPLVK
jgi:hypothetical protein